ncbi:MAG: hypothetical protein Ct9H300mP6_05000 [Gammaproteobacteria bacterium]|nr:MAG: hypothetical protein Ct9H300mP6_05000 [Gammaproteobacteria bacterium]
MSESLIKQAKEQGADIVLLPENFAFMGYPKQLVEELWKILKTAHTKPISKLAKELRFGLSLGHFPL